jgi:nanoRNase/pAp phosphatase (c-di-AMP/oligoRNAs hydrolase)
MTTRSIPRIKTEDRVSRLVRAVEQAPGNHCANIIIAQVDPDAIGAAYGIAEILQALGKETAIWYSGGFSHPQNRVIKNRFNLSAEMNHIGRFSPTMEEKEDQQATRNNNFVLVDSNRANDSRLQYRIAPFLVVDHHKGSDLLDTEEDVQFFADQGFLWLDEGAGSASTMVAELLQQCVEAGIMPEDWKMTEKLATLLAMGIYSDTKNLISGGVRDHEAFRWVSGWTTEATIAQLIDYPLEEPNIQNLCRALQKENRKHQGAHLLSGMGLIDSDYADDLSTVADMLLRMPGVEISITWGGVRFVDEETGDETIKLRVCARSQTLTKDLAEFLRKRFKGKCGAKQLPDGRGEGGAMFELDFDGWMKPDELLEIVDRRLKEWLFDTEEAA